MATAMATGVCQTMHVIAARVVDAPVAYSAARVGIPLRQTAFLGGPGVQALSSSTTGDCREQARNATVVTRAMAENSPPAVKELYEVELEKPWGLRFYKGSDGGTYIDAIAPGGSADMTGMFTPGDKVLATR